NSTADRRQETRSRSLVRQARGGASVSARGRARNRHADLLAVQARRCVEAPRVPLPAPVAPDPRMEERGRGRQRRRYVPARGVVANRLLDRAATRANCDSYDAFDVAPGRVRPYEG